MILLLRQQLFHLLLPFSWPGLTEMTSNQQTHIDTYTIWELERSSWSNFSSFLLFLFKNDRVSKIWYNLLVMKKFSLLFDWNKQKGNLLDKKEEEKNCWWVMNNKNIFIQLPSFSSIFFLHFLSFLLFYQAIDINFLEKLSKKKVLNVDSLQT